MKSDIFYNVVNLKLDDRIKLLNEANINSIYTYVDILDCKVSFARQRTEMSFSEVMEKFNESCHFVVKKRWDSWKRKQYGEIGFCTMSAGPDYFLFIHLLEDKLEEIVELWNLKEFK